jgi:hypothetical protein
MENAEFRAAAHEAFVKSEADKMEWIESLGLDIFDELMLKMKLEDCFVNGMKYGVNVVKDALI